VQSLLASAKPLIHVCQGSLLHHDAVRVEHIVDLQNREKKQKRGIRLSMTCSTIKLPSSVCAALGGTGSEGPVCHCATSKRKYKQIEARTCTALPALIAMCGTLRPLRYTFSFVSLTISSTFSPCGVMEGDGGRSCLRQEHFFVGRCKTKRAE
jgi:hypothetical protein